MRLILITRILRFYKIFFSPALAPAPAPAPSSRVPVAMELRNVPEEVEIEILARISALQLLKLRRVCGRWKDLISTQYFRNTHLIRSKEPESPQAMIIFKLEERKVTILSDKSEKLGETIVLKDLPNCEEVNFSWISLCYDGFIVIERVRHAITRIILDAIIYNPVTREVVVIDGSETRSNFLIYALFFNPRINEYCAILLEMSFMGMYDLKFEMLNLGSRPHRRKTLKTLDRMRMHSYQPGMHAVLVINNENIYWQVGGKCCQEFILGFNIKAEEFCFLPHPPLSQCQELEAEGHYNDYNLHIAHIHGCLSFVQYTHTPSAVTFNMWTTATAEEAPLKWVKTYTVVIHIGFSACRLNSKFELLTIKNGEIVFANHHIKVCVYAYNLQKRTIRRIFYKKNRIVRFFHHVPSFASINSSESKICI